MLFVSRSVALSETTSSLFLSPIGVHTLLIMKRLSLRDVFSSHLNVILICSLILGATAFLVPPPPQRTPNVAAVVTASSPFQYHFDTNDVLHESSDYDQSTSPYWWLNSGAQLRLKNGVGSTVQGNLPSVDRWRLMYAASNPVDTDNGYHPQNIFRLVTKATGASMRVESLFKIHADNWSTSPNRNSSNGLLLMSSYVDGNSLYYAGLRVDGTAVIKKKYKGTYYTITQPKVFSGTYSREGKVNLIPHNEWLGLRSDTKRNADGSVSITLSMKREGSNTWTKIAEGRDDGQYGGTPPMSQGHAGIRTDFMDVSFESFRMEAL